MKEDQTIRRPGRRESPSGRLAAMYYAEQLAASLDPEAVVAAYRDPERTLLEVAGTVFTEGFVSDHPSLAKNAVRISLIHALPPEEYDELVAAHHRAKEERKNKEGFYHSDAFRANAQKGGQVVFERLSDAAKKERSRLATEGRGKVPWGDEEAAYLLSLVNDPSRVAYRHMDKKGVLRGTPNYAALANVVNALFHDGEQVRNRSSLANYIHTLRFKNKNNR